MSRPARLFRFALVASWLLGLWVVPPSRTVHAATFDIPAGDVTALIDAINTANANGVPDVINLAAGSTYVLSPASDARIPFTDGGDNGLPRIYADLTINGNGATLHRDASAPQFRLLMVTGANLTVNDLTLTGGIATVGASGCITSACGGGIFLYGGSLTINNSVFSGNTVSNINSGESEGGALDADGSSLTITNSTFTGNSADAGAAISCGTTTALMNNITVRENTAPRRAGGILVYRRTTLTLTNSRVQNNIANWAGGGISSSGSLIINNSEITGNHAQGPSASFGGGINVDLADSVIITGSLIQNNSSVDAGGGLSSHYTTNITITNTSILDNRSERASGGGLFVDNGGATVSQSTFARNSALVGGGITVSHGTLTAANSTVSGNSASQHGGGVSAESSGIVTLINSTVASNNAPAGSQLYTHPVGSLTLRNTIVAGTAGVNSCDGAATPTIEGRLIQYPDQSCQPASPAANPVLGPLANNGGATLTQALQAGRSASSSADNHREATASVVAPTNSRLVETAIPG